MRRGDKAVDINNVELISLSKAIQLVEELCSKFDINIALHFSNLSYKWEGEITSGIRGYNYCSNEWCTVGEVVSELKLFIDSKRIEDGQRDT